MANGFKKPKKRKTARYSQDEKRAYWIGVGLSASRDNRENLLNSKNPKLRKAIENGYERDNRSDISKRFT